MPYVFNFLGKENKHTHYGHLCVSKCPCMDWNKKTHKLWSFVSKCPCMDCSFLQNTTSVAIFFGTVGTFVAILFICSHTKPIATQEKRHPNLWTKIATRHRFVGPSVRHTFFTMFPSSYHHEIFRSYYHGQKWCPCKRSRSEVKGQGHKGQHPT